MSFLLLLAPSTHYLVLITDFRPVYVLIPALHMHQTGVRMTNEVIRDGEVFHTAVVDVYDFEQQGTILALHHSHCPHAIVIQWAHNSNGHSMCVCVLLHFLALNNRSIQRSPRAVHCTARRLHSNYLLLPRWYRMGLGFVRGDVHRVHVVLPREKTTHGFGMELYSRI